MIPKTIHYCWVGGNPLPKSAQNCINSWKKYCPDYEIIEWYETNYDFTKNNYMREAYEVKKWAFVTDYARLDIIYQHGGIYLDTDVEIIKPFNDLLQLKGFAGFEDSGYVNLGLGFGAEPGNQLIKELRNAYDTIHFIKSDGSFNLVPMPIINAEVLTKHGLVQNNTIQTISDITIFPQEYFCPKSNINGSIRKTKNTYSIHHFDGSWTNDEQKKDKEARWRNYKRHWPHRLLKTIIGTEKYERLKKALRR